MSQAVLLGGSLVCMWVLFRIMSAPIRLVWKLVVNVLCGFALLVVLKILGTCIGLTIGVNLMNILLVALLGLPGLGLLIMLNFFLL